MAGLGKTVLSYYFVNCMSLLTHSSTARSNFGVIVPYFVSLSPGSDSTLTCKAQCKIVCAKLNWRTPARVHAKTKSVCMPGEIEYCFITCLKLTQLLSTYAVTTYRSTGSAALPDIKNLAVYIY